jgi:hypothetical protein
MKSASALTVSSVSRKNELAGFPKPDQATSNCRWCNPIDVLLHDGAIIGHGNRRRLAGNDGLLWGRRRFPLSRFLLGHSLTIAFSVDAVRVLGRLSLRLY